MRSLTKLAEHVPDMLRYRAVARAADVVHFQWLDVQWLDRLLLPRGPLVLTAHDLLPREPRPEINPPTADHVLAVHRLLPWRFRLPLLVLDATGMRISELESLTWGDIDEPRGRWRVSQAVSKTGRARWVPVAPPIFDAVRELAPGDDRELDRRVFAEITGDQLRMIADFADRRGGGLIMLGGRRSFSEGGYAGTPIVRGASS